MSSYLCRSYENFHITWCGCMTCVTSPEGASLRQSSATGWKQLGKLLSTCGNFSLPLENEIKVRFSLHWVSLSINTEPHQNKMVVPNTSLYYWKLVFAVPAIPYIKNPEHRTMVQQRLLLLCVFLTLCSFGSGCRWIDQKFKQHNAECKKLLKEMVRCINKCNAMCIYWCSLLLKWTLVSYVTGRRNQCERLHLSLLASMVLQPQSFSGWWINRVNSHLLFLWCFWINSLDNMNLLCSVILMNISE